MVLNLACNIQAIQKAGAFFLLFCIVVSAHTQPKLSLSFGLTEKADSLHVGKAFDVEIRIQADQPFEVLSVDYSAWDTIIDWYKFRLIEIIGDSAPPLDTRMDMEIVDWGWWPAPSKSDAWEITQNPWPPLKRTEDGSYLYRNQIRIVGWEQGIVLLPSPAFEVRMNKQRQVVWTDSLLLPVLIPVISGLYPDSLQLAPPVPPEPLSVTAPKAFVSTPVFIGMLILGLFIIAALCWWLIRVRKKQQLARSRQQVPISLSKHSLYLLHQIRTQLELIDSRTFGNLTAYVMRAHLGHILPFSTSEMASSELVKKSQKHFQEEELQQLNQLLQNIDLVKYAKADANTQQRIQVLQKVEAFIQATATNRELLVSQQQYEQMLEGE